MSEYKKRRNDSKVFSRVHEVFSPFFQKIPCKLYFQESRSNITVISNFLKTENIAKASKKFWQNIASYIILNEKKAFWGYFADHSLERVPQWVQYSGIGAARHCLASNIVISPLSPATSPRAALDIYNFNIQPEPPPSAEHFDQDCFCNPSFRDFQPIPQFWWGGLNRNGFQAIFQLLRVWFISPDWLTAGSSSFKLLQSSSFASK